METELEAVEKKLRSHKGLPPFEELEDYLRLARELNVRDSQTVARFGSVVLRNYKSRLNEEDLWLVHEQVAVAALDCAALPFAASVLKAIAKKFPDSNRSKKLQGMYFEASGDFEKANKIYQHVLKSDPVNSFALKRLVALERSRGNVTLSMELLKKYLEVYCNDEKAWEELADLYLETLNYRQAAFCFEELLMLTPMNSNYHVRYADTLYTIGGNHNYKTARAYYSKALELTAGGSLRALYGILACSTSISEKVSVQDARSRALIELPPTAARSLLNLYKRNAPDKADAVAAMLETMPCVAQSISS